MNDGTNELADIILWIIFAVIIGMFLKALGGGEGGSERG